jgi:hypothetical protein
VDVQVDEGWFAGATGVAICHAHRHAFLNGEDVFQVRVPFQRAHDWSLTGTGIAEYVPDSLCAQTLHQGDFSAHHWHGSFDLKVFGGFCVGAF